jgi:peptidoglycan/xylan/chitin deacetylase (PgdA/CDA1 family)
MLWLSAQGGGAGAGATSLLPSPPGGRAHLTTVVGVVAHGPRNVPALALTFDDGPGAVTDALLDVLRDHDARATFNVLGERIAGREQYVRRAVSEGHELGVHGWSHADLRDRPLAGARGAARTAAVVAAVCGADPRLFRPPFGFTNRRLQLAAACYRLRTLLWDVDPRDYEEPGAQAIYERMVVAMRWGSIVLLHDDRSALAPTVEAVDRLLQELRRRGWQAVSASQLLAGHASARL